MRTIFFSAVLVANAFFCSIAFADDVFTGNPMEVFADPSDVVVVLDKVGKCSAKPSAYFHIQRTNVNFKEMTAVVLTAISSGKGLRLFVSGCAGDRNIVSHGSLYVLPQ